MTLHELGIADIDCGLDPDGLLDGLPADATDGLSDRDATGGGGDGHGRTSAWLPLRSRPIGVGRLAEMISEPGEEEEVRFGFTYEPGMNDGFSIVSLPPVELILHVGDSAGFVMVFALLIAAILWNLATWLYGLPSSSSHTLIGSIIGVGVANALMNGRSGTAGVDWGQATQIGYALVPSRSSASSVPHFCSSR